MHNEVIKQQPVNFLDLERAYSDFATNFITASAKKKQPFFLYYPSHVSNKKKNTRYRVKMHLNIGKQFQRSLKCECRMLKADSETEFSVLICMKKQLKVEKGPISMTGI